MAFTGTGNFSVANPAVIGSNLTNTAGALLSIKSSETAGTANATGGLLLPRVVLISNTSMAPMISGGGTAAQKLAATGLAVFHVGGNSIDAGLKVWSGTAWTKYLSEIQLPRVTLSNMTANQSFTRTNTTTAYQRLPYQAITIQETGDYRFTVRQQVWFNNNAIISESSFVYYFQLRINGSAVDSYVRWQYLAKGTGGYGYEINFDMYANSIPENAVVELWAATQFNHSAADLAGINLSEWRTAYSGTVSRIIYQKLN